MNHPRSFWNPATPVLAAAILTAGCAPSLGLDARRSTLAAERFECNISQEQVGPNQIRLRVAVHPSCDVASGLAVNVKDDQGELTHLVLDHQLNSGEPGAFYTDAFARPRAGVLLTVKAVGTCKDERPLTGAAQCRVP